MPIAYDTAPEIEVTELRHDHIEISMYHVSAQDHRDELDWINVAWSTGENITTSADTASIDSEGIANTDVTVTVTFVYNGLNTVDTTLTIHVPDVPKDPDLYVDIASEDYVNIPQTDKYIDTKRLFYANDEGKLTDIILPNDPNIEAIKMLVSEDKWKYLNERLVNNPYEEGTLVDLLTGLKIDNEYKVSGKVDDTEEKIKSLKEKWIEDLTAPKQPEEEPKKPEEPEDKEALRTYVLGRKFYTGDLEKMTMFEKEVYKYIQGKQLDINILMDFYKEFPSWSTEEKYYKLPILVVMLKDYIASVRTEI
jgi:hypothetical protein